MKPRMVATLVAAGILLLIAGGDYFARRAYEASVRQEVAANLDLLVAEVVDHVEGVVASVDVLAAFAAVEAANSEGDFGEEFDTFAETLLNQNSSIQSVQLGPDSILRYVSPVAGNEAAVGLDLLADPDRRTLLEPSILTGDVTIQGPVGLVQGGTGIIIRRPVFLSDGQFWGFAAVVVNWDALIDNTRLEHVDGTLSALAAPGPAVLAGDAAALEGDPLNRQLRIRGTDVVWELSSRPDAGWPRFAVISPVLWVAGVVLALLAGAFVQSILHRPAQLQEEVKRALADLAISEARYQATFQYAGTGIVLVDLKGRVVSANPQFRRMAGVDDDDTMGGVRVLSLVHPEDRPEIVGPLRTLEQHGGVVTRDLRLGPPDRLRWCRVRITIIPGPGELPDFVVVVANDITERRASERAVEESERRYRELFELLPIGIHQEDYSAAVEALTELTNAGVEDLREHLSNHPSKLEEILATVALATNPTASLFQKGVSTGESMSLLKVLSPNTRESLINSLVSVYEGREDAEWQIEAEGSDGLTRTLHLRWHVPRKDGEPDFANLLMTLTDVSLLRQTERRLARLVEAKDRFVASVAHELRTPLTAVVGFARTLSEAKDELTAEEQAELHGLVASHAQEMAHLIEDLLVSGRSDVSEVRVHIEKIDLAQVVGEAVFGLPAVDVEVQTPNGPVPALADPVRVRQIVRNLITNALRYGGSDIGVTVRLHDGSAAVEVSDDGPRLSEEESSRIFEPYERIAQEFARPGSIGLGLTVSRSLALLLGGQLVLERIGDRNVFRLTIPLAEDRQPTPS